MGPLHGCDSPTRLQQGGELRKDRQSPGLSFGAAAAQPPPAGQRQRAHRGAHQRADQGLDQFTLTPSRCFGVILSKPPAVHAPFAGDQASRPQAPQPLTMQCASRAATVSVAAPATRQRTQLKQRRRVAVRGVAAEPATQRLTKDDLVAYLESGCKPRDQWRCGGRRQDGRLLRLGYRPRTAAQLHSLLSLMPVAGFLSLTHCVRPRPSSTQPCSAAAWER